MDHFKKVAPGVNDTSDWRVQETKSTLFHQVAAEFLFPVDMVLKHVRPTDLLH